MIKSIKASNFKTFNELDVNLNEINILIGANASGKSNFIDAFRFIRDIAAYGLKNAISMQGGMESLRNVYNDNKDISLVIQLRGNDIFIKKIKANLTALKVTDLTYSFALTHLDDYENFRISSDELFINYEFFKLESVKDLKDEKKLIAKIEDKRGFIDVGSLRIINSDGKLEYEFKTPDSIPEREIISPMFKDIKIPHNSLIVERQIFMPPLPPLVEQLKNISIYDFDPKLCKKAVSITGKKDLEEDGSNLAIVLKNITENPDDYRKFLNLIKDVLPFIDKIKTEKLADKSFFFNLSEIYEKSKFFPASALSDGTINITAIIAALYFERKPFIIIEEPERNIHPYLISRVVSMLRDASRNKQIIITTHNAQMVKHSNMEDLLLISRNAKGFSEISRPAENKEVMSFLRENLGLDELYINSLLE